MNGRNVNVNKINKSTSKIRLFVSVYVEGIVTFYENLICTHIHIDAQRDSEENERGT